MTSLSYLGLIAKPNHVHYHEFHFKNMLEFMRQLKTNIAISLGLYEFFQQYFLIFHYITRLKQILYFGVLQQKSALNSFMFWRPPQAIYFPLWHEVNASGSKITSK